MLPYFGCLCNNKGNLLNSCKLESSYNSQKNYAIILLDCSTVTIPIYDNIAITKLSTCVDLSGRCLTYFKYVFFSLILEPYACKKKKTMWGVLVAECNLDDQPLACQLGVRMLISSLNVDPRGDCPVWGSTAGEFSPWGWGWGRKSPWGWCGDGDGDYTLRPVGTRPRTIHYNTFFICVINTFLVTFIDLFKQYM